MSKTLFLLRLLGGMFLKFPSAQHKQETCSKSPGGANSMLPVEGGRISSWEGEGEGKQQTFQGTPQPSLSLLPRPRKKEWRRRKERHPALGKIGEWEVGRGGAARPQSEPPQAAAVAACGGNTPGSPLPKPAVLAAPRGWGWALRRGVRSTSQRGWGRGRSGR